METKYTCYCGLDCKNCAVKVKVEPAAEVLHDEMKKLGFGEIISFFPDGESFWSFLGNISDKGVCVSCKAGSGNPNCKVKLCAKEKDVETCAFCADYPCEFFTQLFEGYSTLQQDNLLLKEKGWESWKQMQDERKEKGICFSYSKDE